ncbi:hypothetical protein [Pseudomonas putida]|uniref:Molybdopterin biosynthesis enzyme n=1 Tax=Pseudomonas putida TaxID=303 RepID=A0A1L7NPV1_PSEPU|nr:hypothetical protein [Pseudomonas putida]BAW27498.1 Molybdopterin biosynthesis enzyme [Pseudomonas putida]
MSLPGTQKPAWYEHNLHNDFGQVVNTIIADHDGPVFGKPGVDHSEDFKVVTLPLYGAAVVEQLVAANTEYARRHLEQLGEVERLRAKLIKINALIFAAGAPLGGDAYFEIRELCAEELRKASGSSLSPGD